MSAKGNKVFCTFTATLVKCTVPVLGAIVEQFPILKPYVVKTLGMDLLRTDTSFNYSRAQRNNENFFALVQLAQKYYHVAFTCE